MWGSKARRIERLEAQLDAAHANVLDLHGLLSDFRQAHDILSDRSQRLADDLKAAQNALLAEADQNGIREEAIAHVRELIAVGGLCSRCEVNRHVDHTPEGGCPDPGCVCRIRDSDPTGASDG
jgi:hypothetical protein